MVSFTLLLSLCHIHFVAFVAFTLLHSPSSMPLVAFHLLQYYGCIPFIAINWLHPERYIHVVTFTCLQVLVIHNMTCTVEISNWREQTATTANSRAGQYSKNVYPYLASSVMYLLQAI